MRRSATFEVCLDEEDAVIEVWGGDSFLRKKLKEF